MFARRSKRTVRDSLARFFSGSRNSSSTPVHLLRFPQWQGSDDLRNNEGGHVVADISAEVLRPQSESVVPVSKESAGAEGGIAGNSVLHLQSLVSQASSARRYLESSKCTRVFTAGGDCGVEVPSISYLNRFWPGMAVVWFDAHADLNSPASSPSGHYHGMPVRTLLGEGPPDIMPHVSSILRPDQFLYVGVRDVDLPEQAYMNEKEMFCMQTSDWQQLLTKLHSFRQVYLHVDLDVLDPNEFPFVTCPAKGGLRSEELVQGIEEIAKVLPVVGCAVTECCGELDLHAEDLLFFVVESLAEAIKKPLA